MNQSWISFLVTGPEENLMAWQIDAMFSVELFDRRDQTVRCRAHAGPEFMDLEQWQRDIDAKKEQSMDTAEALLKNAVELAQKHDVTVQRLDYADGVESYPALHLGTHQMAWPPAKKKRDRKKKAASK